MAELKPCPFDKKKAWIRFIITSTPNHKLYYVTCTHCFSKTGYYLDEKAAIDAWNKRS